MLNADCRNGSSNSYGEWLNSNARRCSRLSVERVIQTNRGWWGIMGYRGNMRSAFSSNQMFLPEISSGSFNFAHMPPFFSGERRRVEPFLLIANKFFFVMPMHFSTFIE